MRELLSETAAAAADYLETLEARPVGIAATAADLRTTIDVDLTDDPIDPARVVRELREAAEPGVIAMGSGRYFGFVIGCQMAHFTALSAARLHVLDAVGWDVNDLGLHGAPHLRVVVGADRHVTIDRALRYLGIGARSIVPVATDDQGRMVTEALAEELTRADDLTAGVAVMHEFTAAQVAPPDRHLQRVENQVGAQMGRELPTIVRLCTSRVSDTYSQPSHVEQYVMSASHSSFGRAATKRRSTRSGGRAAFASAIVVKRFLPRCTPRKPMSPMRRPTVQRATT